MKSKKSKKIKKEKKEKKPDFPSKPGKSPSKPSKDHSYKIKIKTNKEQDKKSRKKLIKDIKEAVGSDTKIVEDAVENCIICYISATQQLDKKQVKAVLKDVMAGKKVNAADLTGKSGKSKKEKKKGKTKLKVEKLMNQMKSMKGNRTVMTKVGE